MENSLLWKIKSRITLHLAVLLVFNAVLITGLAILSPTFLTIRNLQALLLRMSELAMPTLAQTVVMICGGMDLTVGSVMALSGTLAGLTFKSGMDPLVAIPFALLVGAAIGAINGFLVVQLRIQSFIATVATNSIVRSVVYLLLQGNVLASFPKPYKSLGAQRILGFPLLFLIVIIFSIVLHFVLRRTTLGRSLYAVGANEKCAHISGIHVNYIKYVAFAVSGVLSAVGGIMYTMRIGAIIPDAGLNSPLEVVTAVLIGGASVRGGKGSVLGSLLGVLAMYLLLNGFSLLGLNSFWQVIVLGIALIAIVGQGNRIKVVKMSRFSRHSHA